MTQHDPDGEVWVCIRIFAQLVIIDSNRRLSWIVRNLTELLHHSNLMNGDGYDECEDITPDMVTIVCGGSVGLC